MNNLTNEDKTEKSIDCIQEIINESIRLTLIDIEQRDRRTQLGVDSVPEQHDGSRDNYYWDAQQLVNIETDENTTPHHAHVAAYWEEQEVANIEAATEKRFFSL